MDFLFINIGVWFFWIHICRWNCWLLEWMVVLRNWYFINKIIAPVCIPSTINKNFGFYFFDNIWCCKSFYLRPSCGCTLLCSLHPSCVFNHSLQGDYILISLQTCSGVLLLKKQGIEKTFDQKSPSSYQIIFQLPLTTKFLHFIN